MPKSIIYLSSLVSNQNQNRLAVGDYYLVYVSDDEGTLFPALFEQHEVSVAMNRAATVSPAVPKIEESRFRKFLKKLIICE